MSTKIENLVKLSNSGFKKKKAFRGEFNKIIQTGEDLFLFVSLTKKQRGIGQTIKKAVNSWIFSRTPNKIKKELSNSKYGYDGLDILRIFHPKPINEEYDRCFNIIKKNCKRERKNDNKHF